MSVVQPLFNGNISEMNWKTSLDNQLRNYFYEYDGLNRLKSATSKAGMTLGGYNENNITYDKNGNILTLNRTGINPLSNLSTAIDGLIVTTQAINSFR